MGWRLCDLLGFITDYFISTYKVTLGSFEGYRCCYHQPMTYEHKWQTCTCILCMHEYTYIDTYEHTPTHVMAIGRGRSGRVGGVENYIHH